MPHAVSVKCLNASGEAIRGLWREAERLEDAPSMAALDYPPHLSLGVYDIDDPAALIDFVRTVPPPLPPLAIRFSAIRHFEGDPLTLWAAPGDSAGLADLHAALHRRVAPALCREIYRPGRWVPHCTLAMHVGPGRRDAALAFAEQAIAPFTVIFDALDCVRFPPVTVLAERPLGAARPPRAGVA